MEPSNELVISGELALITAGSVLAILNTSAGLASSRQWTLMPLAVGLLALTAFLLNPLADRSSTEELRSLLLSESFLTLTCSVQLLLSVFCAFCIVKIIGESQSRLWPLLLGSVCCITSPLLATQLLLMEHWFLISVQNSRPETTGMWMGAGAGFVLTLITLLFSLIRQHRLLNLALLTSLLSALIGVLLSAAGRSLPNTIVSGTSISAVESGIATGGILLVIMAGFLLSTRRKTLSV